MPASHRGLPDPWVEAAFPSAPGVALVLDSRTIHCGGGRSPSLPPTSPHRVVAFVTLVDPPRDYQVNAVAMRPPWATQPSSAQPSSSQPPLPTCGVRGCSSPPSASRAAVCARCGCPVCPLHFSLGEVCAVCEDEEEGAHPPWRRSGRNCSCFFGGQVFLLPASGGRCGWVLISFPGGTSVWAPWNLGGRGECFSLLPALYTSWLAGLKGGLLRLIVQCG